MNKYSSKFVDEGITGDQKETDGLRVGKKQPKCLISGVKNRWSLQISTKYRTESYSEVVNKSFHSNHGPLASKKKFRRSKSYWVCNIWEEKYFLALIEGIISSRKQKYTLVFTLNAACTFLNVVLHFFFYFLR